MVICSPEHLTASHRRRFQTLTSTPYFLFSHPPFPENTSYFGDPTKQWMINFRVSDLDRLVAQLEAAGIAVKVDSTTYPNGRFARSHDPEGNPIELWQPKAP